MDRLVKAIPVTGRILHCQQGTGTPNSMSRRTENVEEQKEEEHRDEENEVEKRGQVNTHNTFIFYFPIFHDDQYV